LFVCSSASINRPHGVQRFKPLGSAQGGPGSPLSSPLMAPALPFFVLKNYLTIEYSTAHHASHIPMSSLCFRALWILTPAIGGLTLPVEGPPRATSTTQKPQHEVIHWLTIGQAASRRVASPRFASLGTKKTRPPKGGNEYAYGSSQFLMHMRMHMHMQRHLCRCENNNTNRTA
jgi:hypothetical protein